MTTPGAYVPALAETMLEIEYAVCNEGDTGRLHDVLRHTACRVTPTRQVYGRDDIIAAAIADNAGWQLCDDANSFASPGIGHGTLVALRTSARSANPDAPDCHRHTLALQEVLNQRISREWRISIVTDEDEALPTAGSPTPEPCIAAATTRPYWHAPLGSPMTDSSQTSPGRVRLKQPGQPEWVHATVGEHFGLLNARRFAQLGRRYAGEAGVAGSFASSEKGVDDHFAAIRDSLIGPGDARILPFRFAANGSADDYQLLVVWMMWRNHGSDRSMGASWFEARQGLIEREWLLTGVDPIRHINSRVGCRA